MDRTLRSGLDIADALAAHGQGVCHRDLKPGNIMLTRSRARLLGFDLARLSPPRSSRERDQLTMSSGSIERGTILRD